jgi:WD40 repeat protein/serine/threonine protein kinase
MPASTSQFHREYLLRLPLPLAQLYARAHNAKDARGRHDNAFYLFEATIKLAATPMVAAYLHEIEHGQPRSAALDRLLAQLSLPSLGQWVAILRELARHFGTRPDAAAHPMGHLWQQLSTVRRNKPALLALFCRIKGGPDGQPAGDQSCSILQVLEALVQYRNSVFGHGASRADAFYEQEMGPQLFPAADELLEEGIFDPIGPGASRLVCLTQLRALDDRTVELSMRELTGLQGERLAPLLLPRDQAAALAPNTVAVIWPGWKLPLRLDPLLSYHESDVADELLFLNRDRNGKHVEYLSYTTGRTERDASMAPAMASLLGRIVGAAVTVEQLQTLAAPDQDQPPPVDALFQQGQPQRRTLGDYEIVCEIGRGGMGVVYLARQLSLGRTVALKMLPADLAGDDVALARFSREMRWLARCDHPNIVKILSSGAMPDGQLFYTMEHVPGCDLEQVWRELSGIGHESKSSAGLSGDSVAHAVVRASRAKQSKAEEQCAPSATAAETVPLAGLDGDFSAYTRKIVALIRDAAEALQTVHDQKVIHRDIKPANLMLTPDGSRIVLMDFGLAKSQSVSREASLQGGGLLGTLRYAAPEQLAAASLRVGPAADVRGLAVVLWELLTRKRLFSQAQDERQLAAMVHDQDVPRLRSVDSAFDADLDAIVARATERRAADRIPTAALLAQYLGLWLDHKPLPIRPPGIGETIHRWVREHRALVASTTLAAAIVIAAVVSALILVTRSRNAQVVLRRSAELRLVQSQISQARSLISQGDVLGLVGNWDQAKQCYQEAADTLHQANQPTFWADLGRWAAERASPSPLNQITGITARFVDVAVCPDGRSALCGAADGSVQMVDLATGQITVLPARHAAAVTSVAVASDGSTAVSASRDGTLILWNLTTRQKTGTIDGGGGWITRAILSPDGHFALTISGETVQSLGRRRNDTLTLWDLDARKPIHVATADGRVDKEAISRDGAMLLTAGASLQLWNARTGEVSAKLPGPVRDDSITAVTFSPDAAAAGIGTRAGDLFEVAIPSGRILHSFSGHGASVCEVSFDPDGKDFFSAGEDGTVKRWDTSSGQENGVWIRSEADVAGAAFCPDRQIALLFGGDRLTLWNTALEAGEKAMRKPASAVNSVALLQDGRIVQGASAAGPLLWDAATGQRLDDSALAHPCDAIAASPSGTTLAAVHDATLRILDYVDGHELRSFPVSKLAGPSTLAFAPDGSAIVTGGRDGKIVMWETSSGRQLREFDAEGADITALTVSADGHWLLAGGSDKTARLWDATTGALSQTLVGHQDGINAVAISPDGRLAATGAGNSLIDSKDDFSIRLWRISDGQCVAILKGHSAPVRALAFSPDGQTLISGSDDGTVRFWDVAGGALLRTTAAANSAIVSLCISSDGQSLAFCAADRSLTVWDFSYPSRLAAQLARRNAGGPDELAQWYALAGADDWAIACLSDRVPPLVRGQCWWRAGNVANALEAFKAAQQQSAADPYLQLCVRALSRGQ